MVEYWHVKYHERLDNVNEWTREQKCIAQHPSEWIKHKREFDDKFCLVTGFPRTLWEIVHAVPITKDDYDSFNEEN